MFFVLLPTFECNLRCTYCFEEHPEGRWDIPKTTQVLDAVFDVCQQKGVEQIRLHWQGGEALVMGQGYWEEVLPLAQKKAAAADISLYQAMQTNLVEYDTWVGVLAKRFLDGRLGTSFEPFPDRRYSGGDGTRFQAAWKVAYARAIRDDLEVGVLSLLNDQVLAQDASKYLDRLAGEFGIRHMRFSLPFGREPGARGYWIDPVKAGRFLVATYQHWKELGGKDFMELEPFTYLEASLRNHGEPGRRTCMYTPNCAETATSILPDGNVVLCDNFAQNTTFSPMGNVFAGSLATEAFGPWRQQMVEAVASLYNDECCACPYLSVCNAGCLVRSRLSADGKSRSYHYCETMKMLLAAIEAEVVQVTSTAIREK